MDVPLPLPSTDKTVMLGSTANGELETFCNGDMAKDRGATVEIDSKGKLFLIENSVSHNLYDGGDELKDNNVWLVVSNQCWAAVVYEIPPDGTWTVAWATKGTNYEISE